MQTKKPCLVKMGFNYLSIDSFQLLWSDKTKYESLALKVLILYVANQTKNYLINREIHKRSEYNTSRTEIQYEIKGRKAFDSIRKGRYCFVVLLYKWINFHACHASQECQSRQTVFVTRH